VLEVVQERADVYELAVEAHLVAEDIGTGVVEGDGEGVQLVRGIGLVQVGRGRLIMVFFGRWGREVGQVVADLCDGADDGGGFGADGAGGAPEAVGDFDDKAFLEFPDGAKFVEE